MRTADQIAFTDFLIAADHAVAEQTEDSRHAVRIVDSYLHFVTAFDRPSSNKDRRQGRLEGKPAVTLLRPFPGSQPQQPVGAGETSFCIVVESVGFKMGPTLRYSAQGLYPASESVTGHPEIFAFNFAAHVCPQFL